MSEPSRKELERRARQLREIVQHWDYPIGSNGYQGSGPPVVVGKGFLEEIAKDFDRLAAKPERERVIGRLCDSNYVAGLTLGWNLGLTEDRERFDAAVNSPALKGDPASTVAHLPNVVVTKQEW